MPCPVDWEGIYEIFSGAFECFDLYWSRQVDFFELCWLTFFSPLPEKDFFSGMSKYISQKFGSDIAAKKMLRRICK